MLREAFAFPRNREGATRDLLVGGALVLAAPLVVPAVLLYGYLLAVMNAAARDRSVPPAFGDWGRLLVDGLKAIFVVVVYALLPVAITAGGTVAAAYVLIPLWNVRAASHTNLAIVGGVAAVLAVFALLLLFLLPAALVGLATQGRLGAAFQLRALWAVASTRQYLGGLVLAVVVATVGSAVASLLTPVLVGFVLLFFVQVATAYLVGRSVGGAAVTAIKPVE